MKKFSFPLDKLRNYRQMRFQQEEARLQRMLAEIQFLEQQRQALLAEEQRAVDRVRELSVIPVEDLVSLDLFRQWSEHERSRMKAAVSELRQQVERQRAVVVQSKRELEMLAHLRDRSQMAWRRAADQELESNVAELVTSRWKGGEPA
jgi:flagellar export protein FliJ